MSASILAFAHRLFTPAATAYYRYPSNTETGVSSEETRTSPLSISQGSEQAAFPRNANADPSQPIHCGEPPRCGDVAPDHCAPSEQGSEPAHPANPASMALATFREFYRSRDGRITVFEDRFGHLTSVDSSRLV